MPIPSKDNKSEHEFMSECVSMLVGEGKDQGKAVAICSTEWNKPQADNKQPEKKPKGKLELLTDIKKMIEKNGQEISDDSLLELFDKMTKKAEDVKTFSLSNKLEALIDDQVIKVFPKKKVYIEKYNEVIDFNDQLFDDMIASFENPKLFKPYIDKDHELGEKFGEILHLFKQDDGLYAKVQLNDKGIDAVKGNVYSYISPEWGSRINTDKEVCKNVLWAITLTNIPALEGELPTLQDQIKLSRQKLKGVKMDDLNKKIIQLSTKRETYTLQGEVDPAAVMALVDELFASLEEMKMKYDELKGVSEGQEEQIAEAQAQLKKIEDEKQAIEKETFFNNALEKGLIDPKDHELWSTKYDSDKDFVQKFVLSREPKEDGIKLSSNSPNYKSSGLDEIDLFVMSERGLDRNNPEHVRQYKLSQGDK